MVSHFRPLAAGRTRRLKPSDPASSLSDTNRNCGENSLAQRFESASGVHFLDIAPEVRTQCPETIFTHARRIREHPESAKARRNVSSSNDYTVAVGSTLSHRPSLPDNDKLPLRSCLIRARPRNRLCWVRMRTATATPLLILRPMNRRLRSRPLVRVRV